ncbi:MAG TPA: hypothetical protein VI818_02260, partial [Candidatus Thermoplasmatota archaeon]|nr:hypothetical protein [Candidatus Thermoplasmatota archaeon]
RVLLALAGESMTGPGAARTINAVTIVDVTDPGEPKRLATWSPPFQPKLPWTTYAFSVHEMAATPQGQLAVAWYHGGVWVVDLSTKERQEKPTIIGAYQPHEAMDVVPTTWPENFPPMVPDVWGVGWDQRGYLVVPDVHTGVYVLEPSWGLHRMFDGGQ